MNKSLIGSVIAGAVVLSSVPTAHADSFTVALTRFGGCIGAGCVIEIVDNGPLDNSNVLGVISFNQPIVGQAPNVFSASGIATETITRDAQGKVVSILMNLTEATVNGEAGASTPGQIALISSEPLVSLSGVSGFAALDGRYETGFATGILGDADILLQARLGGVLLGLVDPPPGDGAQSPAAFAGFNSRSFPSPVANLLFGVFDFNIGSNDAIVLPGSGEAFAQVPEPASFAMLAIGLAVAGAAGWRRRRR